MSDGGLYLAVHYAANERMQLTWLLGAPSRAASVHRRVVGQGGLGSPATQLMRAVRWLGKVQSMEAKRVLQASLALGLIILAVSCSSANGIAATTAVLSPTPPGFSRDSFSSPSGLYEFERECEDVGMTRMCKIVFESGNRTELYTWILWSDDDRFAMICAITNSSFACLGGTPQVWDMAQGSLVGTAVSLRAGGNVAAVWKPKEHLVVYFDIQTASTPEFRSFDADTHVVSDLEQCPDWIGEAIRSGELSWAYACDALEGTQAPTSP